MTLYSFCETLTAGGATPWHIRKLTHIGQKLGGGADTLALCGIQVSWDIGKPFTIMSTTNACRKCCLVFTDASPDQAGQEQG
mgnify:CR=1 FL=1